MEMRGVMPNFSDVSRSFGRRRRARRNVETTLTVMVDLIEVQAGTQLNTAGKE